MITRWAEGDPGPCPVDDAPHTTCTSPDYVPLSEPVLTSHAHPSVVVPVRAPRMPLVSPTPPPMPQGRLGPPALPDKPFTTKTYRRKKTP